MKITVTEKDILRGRGSTSHGCPVALAIQRATGDRTATVGYAAIHIRRGITLDYPLKSAVLSFVRAFDADKYVKPFSFTLPIKKVGRKLVKI